MENSLVPHFENIATRILLLRGERVLLDFDLAQLYQVETRALKQAVRRNIERFPPDFMFELTDSELEILRSQFVISSWGGLRYSPMAFTEQGIAMLSGVLKSARAIEVNIAIMRTFVDVRRNLDAQRILSEKLCALEVKYDTQFQDVFQALDLLLNPPTAPLTPIGFKLPEKK